MSTQPEPQTKAGRELLDRQSDPDWMDLDYAPKLAAILAIEDEATAAARAEVARQVRELPWNVSGSTDDPEWAVSEYRDAVLALLEDAAPRQPTDREKFLHQREVSIAAFEATSESDADRLMEEAERAADVLYPKDDGNRPYEAYLPAAPRQPEPDFDESDNMCPNCITPWKCNGPHLSEQTVAARRHAAPDTTTGADR